VPGKLKVGPRKVEAQKFSDVGSPRRRTAMEGQVAVRTNFLFWTNVSGGIAAQKGGGDDSLICQDWLDEGVKVHCIICREIFFGRVAKRTKGKAERG
jgi:hypothetical protein